jgi:hypothetical protein
MDVVLGVAVTGPVARLALVGTGDAATGVIDQSVVDLANNPVEQLVATVVGTDRLLADENHRLVGTRLCWTDNPKADQVRQALEDSGVHNVAVLTESQAVKSLMRAAGRPGAALLFDEATATLSLVDSAVTDEDAPPTLLAQGPLAGGEATTTLDTMMARLGEQPDALTDVYLVGASADLDRVADQLRETPTMRVQIAEDPTFALARGAALAAAPLAPDATAMAPVVLTGDETAMAPVAGLGADATAIVPTDAAEADQQLAYSMADDDEADLLPDELDDFDDYGDAEAVTGPLKLSRQSLLVGNAVIAFAVIGFASLAVALVVGVRPTSSQEPVVGHQNAAPGKFMPLLPTQQQAPVPLPPPEAPNLGYQGGTIPAPAVPAQVPAAPITPGTPGEPGVPGFVPNPNPAVPIPVPIFIPFPGWRPQPWVPPYIPPYTPPTTPTTTPYTPPTTTTPSTPTTTPYTPPTTTTPSTPTTTPYTPPTTTTPSTPTTTPYTPPTTSSAPTTTPYTPPTSTTVPTTVAPTTVAPTTVAPTTVAPTVAPSTKAPTQVPTQPTVAPAPTRSQPAITQAPAIPKQPSTGSPHH